MLKITKIIASLLLWPVCFVFIYMWSSAACSLYMSVLWQRTTLNSLAPGRFEVNFRQVIFKENLVNAGCGISCEIALRWIPLDLVEDKSTSVQAMAWCPQASSHCLSQCWSRYMSPYGVTRAQRVKHAEAWITWNGNLCSDDIFKFIFLKEDIWFHIKFGI